MTYVCGCKQNVCKIRPLYPPKKWNVFEATISGGHRTNNHCESWNNSFKSLVRCNHPSIWVAIDAIRKDSLLVEHRMAQNMIGEPPRKKCKQVNIKLQSCLRNLCLDFMQGDKDVEELLNGVSKNIRLYKM